MKKIIFQLLFTLVCLSAFSQNTLIKYLSGKDKDHTVQWDFYCTVGRNSGKWTKIAVPSNWESQGFGSYNYGHDKVKSNEQGRYKYEFTAGKSAGKRIFIVFEGAMTDSRVLINGKQAGEVHQGGFYEFKYDITDLIKPNQKNLLEVTVDKTSANASINNAERNGDFWLMGGLFRPVFLEIVPRTFMERIAIDARADGSFQTEVFSSKLKKGETVEVQIQKLNGENVGKSASLEAVAGQQHFELKGGVNKPLLWSSEFPNLYQAIVRIRSKSGIIHQIKQKFGFRTVALRKNDGLYVNGAKIMLKGSNRHSFWPETGRTLSHAIQLMDVKLMKEMNMNAVRMSHYPPDRDFLNVCDSLGLYVIDELTGWQAKYDSGVGHRLVKELVVRDVNHPSVILWANGNEGGWNTELDNDYDLYDTQKRTVIHPWEKFNGTDTKHYPAYNDVAKAVASGQEVYFPTEFMHGLYDGGAGAGLDDFWGLMRKHPHGAGGFIWAFLDESIIRTDKNGIYDGDGNHAPDGIVGPHREKEASFYTIKEIWSPVYINPQPLVQNFEGTIPVENRYAFTNLSQCTFKWKLVNFPAAFEKGTLPEVKAGGLVRSPDLKPGESGMLHLDLPTSWSANDALYLTAYGPDKKEIFTWSWAIHAPEAITKATVKPVNASIITHEETANSIQIKCDRIIYHFDKNTGYIQKVVKPSGTISLSGGPVLAGINTSLKQFSYKLEKGKYLVEASYSGAGSLQVKWTFSPGELVKLEYQYGQQGEADFAGITFNYPEEKMTGIKYLGQGPYRVWKNRLKGQSLGVWDKLYNKSVTGESWGYPEFKGYYAQLNWVVIGNRESPFTVYTNDKNKYLQILRPDREKAALNNNNVEPAFPEGNIGFLDVIPAIGTKFQAAAVMGPQSQKTQTDGLLFSGTLLFDFNH